MSYRLEQQSDGTSRIAEITGAQGLTLPRYRRGWVSVDEKADVLDTVIADDGKSADVTVQYLRALAGRGTSHTRRWLILLRRRVRRDSLRPRRECE